jgi:hypothetical protein
MRDIGIRSGWAQPSFIHATEMAELRNLPSQQVPPRGNPFFIWPFHCGSRACHFSRASTFRPPHKRASRPPRHRLRKNDSITVPIDSLLSQIANPSLQFANHPSPSKRPDSRRIKHLGWCRRWHATSWEHVSPADGRGLNPNSINPHS